MPPQDHSSAQFSMPDLDRIGELSDELRTLEEATVQQRTGLNGLIAARPLLIRLFGRILQLQEQIDKAFAGQPFNDNYSPVAPANIQRFNAFFRAHDRAGRLFARAIESWVLTCGIRWECNSRTCAANNCPRRGKRQMQRRSVAVN